MKQEEARIWDLNGEKENGTENEGIENILVNEIIHIEVIENIVEEVRSPITTMIDRMKTEKDRKEDQEKIMIIITREEDIDKVMI